MKIKFVRLENFRNVEFADVNFDSDSVWICGKNAQGKTNLLEALGMLSAMRSFRTTDMRAMVRHGKKEARILAGVSHETLGECEVCVSISDRRRAYVDDAEIGFSDFIGRFPTLALGNDDIKLLRGAPDTRRRDSDMFISSIDPAYYVELKNYYAALAQRNALLRSAETAESMYSPFERQMAESARLIFDVRHKRLGELGEIATRLYEILARENGESANIKIKSDCEIVDAETFEKTLVEQRAKDIENRSTRHGPHRDDFKILVGGKDAKLYASEGQQRSAVISLKLAQYEILRRERNVLPAILCDDILGELDDTRRAAFWSCIAPDAQVVATSTSPAPVDGARVPWTTVSASGGTFSVK